jgi:hypothetical protein
MRNPPGGDAPADRPGAVTAEAPSHGPRTKPDTILTATGVAYAVWVGIGAIGAALVAATLFGERLTTPQVLFLALIAGGIIGLKVVSPTKPAVEQPPASSPPADQPAEGEETP